MGGVLTRGSARRLLIGAGLVAALSSLGFATTTDNIFAFAAWEEAEGGNGWRPGNVNRYNVLNTTLQYDNSISEPPNLCSNVPLTTPGCATQSYNSASDGLYATVTTLNEPQYATWLGGVFGLFEVSPGASLANLLNQPPFSGSWPNDAQYVAQEYAVEVQTGQAWNPGPSTIDG